SRGYEVLNLGQIWRNAHGRISKDGREYFVKIGSTPDIGESVRNEVAWNQQLNSRIGTDQSFLVPQIVESGNLDDLYYYVSDFHEGDVISAADKPASTDLPDWLPRIVEANHF